MTIHVVLSVSTSSDFLCGSRYLITGLDKGVWEQYRSEHPDEYNLMRSCLMALNELDRD